MTTPLAVLLDGDGSVGSVASDGSAFAAPDDGSSSSSIDYPDEDTSDTSDDESSASTASSLYSPDAEFSHAWAEADKEAVRPTATCLCCMGSCYPARGPGRRRRVARLCDLNLESVVDAADEVNAATGREAPDGGLPAEAAVSCGEHVVCVRCIRAAADARPEQPPALLACLAAGCDCQRRYGDGVRWCWSAEAYARRTGQHTSAEVVCGCGRTNRRLVYAVENTRVGSNVQKCECGTQLCFDCGLACAGDRCQACSVEPAPRCRPSLFFPEVDNRAVTPEQVAGRAVEMLEDGGECVRCHHCGLRLARTGGCKVVTHCGREVCVQCNARGQRSTGLLRGCCNVVRDTAAERLTQSLYLLLGTTAPETRCAAVALVRGAVRRRGDELGRLLA